MRGASTWKCLAYAVQPAAGHFHVTPLLRCPFDVPVFGRAFLLSKPSQCPLIGSVDIGKFDRIRLPRLLRSGIARSM